MESLRKKEEIYKVVSNYYKNKDLAPDEFSNRLYMIECIMFKEYSLGDCIDFLDRREHWWEYDKENRADVKIKTRNQIKSILKKLDLQLDKNGIMDLRE